MAGKIFGFIRHAQYQQLVSTPSAHQPFALTEDGIAESIAQAQKLSTLIADNNWQLAAEFGCSTMLRAWQTASLFEQTLQSLTTKQISIETDDALAERSVGAVANLDISQIEAVIEHDPRYDTLPHGWKSDSHFRLPFQGAESLLQAGERVAAYIQQQMSSLTESEQPQLKLFFGHGASFRHAAYHMGILEFEQIAQLSMFYAQPILFEQTESGQWKLIAGEWKQRVKVEALD